MNTEVKTEASIRLWASIYASAYDHMLHSSKYMTTTSVHEFAIKQANSAIANFNHKWSHW